MENPRTLHIKVPWGHISGKTWGNEDNIRVLVVHGLLDNAGSFDRLIAKLPKNMYYICIDLPGHGLSSHFPQGVMLNYLDYVLAIKLILDELHWDRAIYMGHSLGAHLGVLFTTIYPDRIEKLVLIDGTIARSLPNKAIISKIRLDHDLTIKGLKLTSPPLYTKEEILYALKNSRKCCLTLDAARAVFERSVTKVGNDSYYYNRDFRARYGIQPYFNKEQNLYLLSQIKVRTLVIFPTDTMHIIEVMRDDITSVLKKLNYIDIVEVKGNHDVHNNHPERIYEHISTFLNEISSKL